MKMGLIFSFWLSALTALGAVDPLFSRMVGDWAGTGDRHYPLSGRQERVEIAVHSRLEGGMLISRNDVREIPPPAEGPPRVYTRTYWIRPVAGAEARYELGTGEGDAASVTANGILEGERFSVEQNLGGQPPLVIRSGTEFRSPDETLYVETGWHGETQITDTTLLFKRAR